MMSIRIALIQLRVVGSKREILRKAVESIQTAVNDKLATVVVLPESFNCPYDEEALKQSAERIPSGETSETLSKAAKDFGVYVVGGSIVETSSDDGLLYNTCVVWNPSGQMVAKYRKIHLGDANSSSKPIIQESALFTAGNSFATFQVGSVKFGLGICWDMRFPEMASIYRQLGCAALIYPSLCDVKTGELHWELLARSRALDYQMFVAFCSPAKNSAAKLVAFGHSLVADPWGKTIAMGSEGEEIVVADLKLDLLAAVRLQIPVSQQRRDDLYEVRNKTRMD
ncbi:omega-amidase NIT2-like [Topomyia yanbarensis]|uniref:omega-amidase NIT2-like n=1 Tax=Topomyia yanbarensis TaxID=2498891 RepID=UPI00273B2376|nr:omega-amidase NIT2-like [Topomyia yanbarensis]